MNAEIIAIGDELLIGQVTDTNSNWIAQQLNSIGIRVKQITIISDNKEHIIKAMDEAKSRSDIILITGGLGPTKDDITKQSLCEYFDTSLTFNKQAYENIKSFFEIRGFEVTELNRTQAFLPKNCLPIKNVNGTASGMWFEKISHKKNKKIFISMPGVPYEMKEMLRNQIIPKLKKYCKTHNFVYKTILTQGIGESFLSELISEWEKGLPNNVKLAYLPEPGIVKLRLTAYGNDKTNLNHQINSLILKLKKIIPKLIFGYDNDTLEEITGKLLKEKHKTLSTAESCTGGYIASMITSVPGSSKYYKGSVVTYSNETKNQILGIKAETLEKYGAVSEQVVTQMAVSAKEMFNTDYAISTSGIAGPDGGSADKPVGTIWIAVATPDKVIAKKYLFGENRGRNIKKTALTTLNMLRNELNR